MCAEAVTASAVYTSCYWYSSNLVQLPLVPWTVIVIGRDWQCQVSTVDCPTTVNFGLHWRNLSSSRQPEGKQSKAKDIKFSKPGDSTLWFVFRCKYFSLFRKSIKVKMKTIKISGRWWAYLLLSLSSLVYQQFHGNAYRSKPFQCVQMIATGDGG